MTETVIRLAYVVAALNKLLMGGQADPVSDLKPSSQRPQFTGRTMIPLPRVMKVKLVPQFATRSPRSSPVSLHGRTTDSPNDKPTGITSFPVGASETAKCLSTNMGVLKTLLSKEIDRDHPCGRTAGSVGTRVGIITCPCCGRKIEINLNLGENQKSAVNVSEPGIDSSPEPTELSDLLDYHGN